MEKILYFDCFSGISGDMTLGALIDLGLSPQTVIEEIGKLGIGGYSLHIEKAHRYAISGTDVDVRLTAEARRKVHDHLHDHGHSHHNGQEHQHEEHHHHNQQHDDQGQHHDDQDHQHDEHHQHDHHHDDHDHHEHQHNEAGGHVHADHEQERNLQDIITIIAGSSLSQKVKEMSIAIFTEIAKAEAHVHGKPIEEVHFHEVGAVDSIVDIVGAAICIDLLQVDRICCSLIHEGQGFVRCDHGLLPVPVPAVMAMLQGSHLSLVTDDVQGELVTPTGIGILNVLASACGPMPQMHVEGIGYGFGKRDTGRLNALRVVLGTAAEEEKRAETDGFHLAAGEDRICRLETNLDDCTGEVLGYTMEQLMAAGALDVFYTSIYMKKNRPAYLLSVLCKEEDRQRLAAIIFKETGSLGIRYSHSNRMLAERKSRETQGDLGPVRVKEGAREGLLWSRPEYEDCAELARKNQLSLYEVYEMVKRREDGKEFGKNI